QDVWTQYVELSRGSDATFTFPTALDPAAIAGLAVQVNYRGSLPSYVHWSFELWVAAAGAWLPVGDNGFAQDWVWSAAVLPVPGPVHGGTRGDHLHRCHPGRGDDRPRAVGVPPSLHDALPISGRVDPVRRAVPR